MKTTLELPENLLREAQEEADRKGQPLGVFVEDAIKARLGIHAARVIKPWQKHFGSLRHLHEESARIEQAVAKEFRTVETEASQ